LAWNHLQFLIKISLCKIEWQTNQEEKMLRQLKPTISRDVIIALLVLVGWFPQCAAIRPFTNISPERAQALINRKANNPHLIILDVRTPQEFSTGHLKGALNIDFKSPDFASKIDELDKSATYLVYCLVGGRSGKAMKLMQEKGFSKVFNLEGGITKWEDSNLPVE
jgi:rhodanese-related sulfurtransferase